MLQQGRLPSWTRRLRVSPWGAREILMVAATGALGGALSGVAGLGENTIMFVLLVLLFRVSEKIATPTTVVLLTAVSQACFLTHWLVTKDFHGVVFDYWLAAAPVCAVGAPLGALLFTRMSIPRIRGLLFVLTSAEWLSTLLIVPMTTGQKIVFCLVTLISAVLLGMLLKVRRYADPVSLEGHLGGC